MGPLHFMIRIATTCSASRGTPGLQVDLEAFLAEANTRNLDRIAHAARWVPAVEAVAVFLVFVVANNQT